MKGNQGEVTYVSGHQMAVARGVKSFANKIADMSKTDKSIAIRSKGDPVQRGLVEGIQVYVG